MDIIKSLLLINKDRTLLCMIFSRWHAYLVWLNCVEGNIKQYSYSSPWISSYYQNDWNGMNSLYSKYIVLEIQKNWM